MTTPRPEPKSEKNLDGYGAPPIPWSKIRDRLDHGITQAPNTGGPNRHTCWLTTLDPDGRAHVTGIGVLWLDDTFYFNSGLGTRKSKNLARDPRCTLAVATQDFDLIVEGAAALVTNPATVARVAEAFRVDWPAEVAEDGISLRADYSAPSAGPPPWSVYAITPQTVYALGTSEPGGAERWQF